MMKAQARLTIIIVAISGWLMWVYLLDAASASAPKASHSASVRRVN
jgi:hypothetical protein